VTLGLTVLFLGIDKTTVLDLTLIGSISPIIVVLGGLIFFHEKVTRREQIGIGTALVGTFVAIIAPILGTNAIGLSGNILIFIYVIIDAISVLFAKQLARHRYSQLQTTMIGFQIGFITLLPFALYMHSPDYLISSIIDLPVKYHLGVLYMAIFSGLAAYLLRNRGQQSIEVGEAQLFSYLQPIISVPLAVLWLGEDLTYLFVLGAVIIGAGVTIAEYKSQRRKSVKHTLHPNIAR
jgi:drug/metabolite transporter (DMT)-like permease